MNLSPLAVGLIVAVVTALLAALGWLIVSQVQTNKSITRSINDIVTEFKVAMTRIEERSNTQNTLCQHYRSQIDNKNKEVLTRLDKIDNRIDNMHP